MRKKRFLSLLLATVITGAVALSQASCSSDNDDSGNSNNPAQQYSVAGTRLAGFILYNN